MLDSRGKTKGGWFFILGFNMLKPNMSNTISIGTCSSDLYIHYFFETSGTASCGTTGIRSRVAMLEFLSFPKELPLYKIVLASPSDFGVDHIDATGLEHSQTPSKTIIL